MILSISMALAMMIAENNDVQIDRKKPYWSEEGWTVYAYPNEESCDIGVENTRDQYMSIGYSAKKDAMSLIVTNKAATSLVDGQTVKLSLATLIGKKANATWSNISFQARRIDGRGIALSTSDLSTKFLSEIAEAEVLGLFSSNNKIVAGFSLNGSARAVDALRECSYKMGSLNPDDPFLP